MGGNALTRLLLDTQVIVWLAEGNPRLGPRTRDRVDGGLQGGTVLVSAFSFWEIAMIIRRGRLETDEPAEAWRREALDKGMEEVPVTGDIGISAVGLDGLHDDPADRIMVATALRERAVLVTSDRRILGWGGAVERHDART